MITTILSDFSYVILLPKDKSYTGKLNGLHKKLTEQYGDYDFFDHFKLNQAILDFYKELSKKYSVNIFTSGAVQNVQAVRKIIDPIFDNIYTAKDYNIDKKDPKAYEFIAEKLGKRPKEILFTDDKEKNIEAAKKAEIITVLYKNFNQFKKDIKIIL
jgi:HAD superfamily hydrolase (TIGR01549 family)